MCIRHWVCYSIVPTINCSSPLFCDSGMTERFLFLYKQEARDKPKPLYFGESCKGSAQSHHTCTIFAQVDIWKDSLLGHRVCASSNLLGIIQLLFKEGCTNLHWHQQCIQVLISLHKYLANIRPSHRRRKWQPTPLFLPRKTRGQRSLVGCYP